MHDEATTPTTPPQTKNNDEKFRTTVTLTEQELTSLDELRVHFRRVEKRKVDQSQLIREAIRHYHDGILARS
jgi:hypothetical protein